MHVQFYDELLKFFTRAVRDVHEAQDLVQDTFGRVLAKVARGERIDDLRGLLYEIARNLLIDRHRMLQVRDHVADAVLDDLSGPASDDPAARYAGRQRLHLLVRTIEALPPRCREAFVLHKIDGLPQLQIAARMGISLNMVERHIMLAVAACRRALGDGRGRGRTAVPADRPEPVAGSARD